MSAWIESIIVLITLFMRSHPLAIVYRLQLYSDLCIIIWMVTIKSLIVNFEKLKIN